MRKTLILLVLLILVVGTLSSFAGASPPDPKDPSVNTMHVEDIVGIGWYQQLERWIMKVLVTDQDGMFLSPVLVDATITTPTFEWERWRMTNSGSWARFWAPMDGPGVYGICIDNLTLEGYTYEPGDNVYTCRDWNLP